MTVKIPFADRRKPRALQLSDEAWQALAEDAILTGAWPNLICERLIAEYLARPADTAPHADLRDVEKKQHSLRIAESVWKGLRKRALQEGRFASSIVEQLIREYYGLFLLPRLDG